MSTFIERADYANTINDNLLDDITEISDEIIDACELEAIEFMVSFLNARYDVDNIFNKTGAERHTLILKYAKDVSIYYLHNLINANKTPSFRAKNYEHAEAWLKGVRDGDINPRNLPLLTDGSKDYIQFGSNPKRTNHI